MIALIVAVAVVVDESFLTLAATDPVVVAIQKNLKTLHTRFPDRPFFGSKQECSNQMTVSKGPQSSIHIVPFVFLALSWVGHAPAQTAKQVAKKTAQNSTTQEVQHLKGLVQAQQRQINQQGQQLEELKSQLQQLLAATQQASATTLKAQNGLDQVQSAANRAQQSATEAQHEAEKASGNAVEAKVALVAENTRSQDTEKKISALQDVLGRFRLSGDIRVRGEDLFQAGVPDRNRARLRVRFGIDGKLNEDFAGGIALATGSLGDPTTTNETFTNFFARKTIGLDRGFVTYNPVAHRWLSLTGGKFAYNWVRTQVTGDPDINPEGFTEKASWDFNGRHVENLTVSVIQTMFNESATGADSYSLGGQVAGRVQIGRLTSMPSFLAMKWNNPDSILQASAFAVQATTTTGGFPVPGEGPGCSKGSGLPTVPPCVFAANTLTNATYNDTSGNPHFYSQYLYADFILNNHITTKWDRVPVNLLLEYQNNLDAKDHPLGTAGTVRTDLGKQSHAYMADISLGQSKTKNDIQIGYSWLREEQDAALASFADSDQRAPTNVLQQRWYAMWKLRSNTVASYTFWYGRTLNSSLQHAVFATGVNPGQEEPHLKRMQFDLIYSF